MNGKELVANIGMFWRRKNGAAAAWHANTDATQEEEAHATIYFFIFSALFHIKNQILHFFFSKFSFLNPQYVTILVNVTYKSTNF